MLKQSPLIIVIFVVCYFCHGKNHRYYSFIILYSFCKNLGVQVYIESIFVYTLYYKAAFGGFTGTYEGNRG